VKRRLIYSMSVSVDGVIADRDGAFGWSVPSDELFCFHLEQVRGLGGCLLGRGLHETMLVWETDASLRDNEDTDAFADVWSALPKVVFSRTLDRVQGNARLAETPLAEEVAAALAATDKDVEIGGAGLASGRQASPRPLHHPICPADPVACSRCSSTCPPSPPGGSSTRSTASRSSTPGPAACAGTRPR
jgi:dihydrofolate reductase